MRLRLEKMIIWFTRGMNLRSKILILYGLILLAPTLILGSGAIYMVIRSFHHSYLVTVDEAVRQTARNVDFGKQSYDFLAVRTATDGELIARLGREYTEMSENVDTVNYVDRTFLITSKYLPGIADFRIYHTNPTLVQDGQLLWRPEDRKVSGMDERTWYNNIMKSSRSLEWSSVPGNPDQLIITRKILSYSGEMLGVVYILLNYDNVFGEMLNHPFSGDGSLYIVDDSRRILGATDRTHIGARMVTKDWPDIGMDGEGASAYNPVSSKDLMISKPLSSGWHVVAAIHMKYMDHQNRSVLYLIVGITAFFLLLSIFLMMTIVKNIVWRIRKLGTRMSDLSRGEFDVSVRHQQNDELGDLENMFNSMSGRIGKLVDDITKTSIMEREQAFKALQAQINPHFIYNSLGLIRWRALDVEDDEQIRIIDALTTFYRLTLNNQISVIPIRDELEHVRAYLEIQQFRYHGRIQIEWEIDETALGLYTLKTVLQPIVENCYLHGAITRKKGAILRITVMKEGGQVRMSVYDNGQGIPSDTLQAIEEGSYVGQGNGFGMTNIKERLALYFGDQAKFTMESAAGEWTLVSIVFPACTEEPVLRREQ
ncbi:sensor histidine kinase [Paenibacillus pinihumi]|uniref:sensor histidine kinase n=1 Tax=Paenibacillus pinihumi TaxID=669462 RepID=UPI00041F046C|nr:sensor histidine kinase [Paenibacillus pinihumi]